MYCAFEHRGNRAPTPLDTRFVETRNIVFDALGQPCAWRSRRTAFVGTAKCRETGVAAALSSMTGGGYGLRSAEREARGLLPCGELHGVCILARSRISFISA